jgi:hypothetical protein
MDSKSFLTQYVTERLPQQAPQLFDGAPDEPHFTVDQRYVPPAVQATRA